MCLVCIEFSKNKLKPAEAIRNLNEMREEIGEEHYLEAYNKLYNHQLEEDLDEYWARYYYEQVGFGD